jgi:hypothetical protein
MAKSPYLIAVVALAAAVALAPAAAAGIGPVTGCASPGQKLVNPGFESGPVGWKQTPGVIRRLATGGWVAWLDGYGTAHTDSLSQSVAIPAGCSATTFSFWLRVDSAETTTTTQFDRLTVRIDSTVLATYSNLNETPGYVHRTFAVGAFAGRTVTVSFTGVEDAALQTSFVVDDTALTAA